MKKIYQTLRLGNKFKIIFQFLKRKEILKQSLSGNMETENLEKHKKRENFLDNYNVEYNS